MEIIISNASNKPIYEQITDQVKAAILAGELAEGEQLPSIRTLASSLRVSVITTKRAYTDLEAAGFIETVQGKGSFVAGGNVDGVPSNRAFLRAADGAWEALPDFPGTPRVQPVAGTLETPRGEAFALVGGFHFDAEKKRATLDRAGFVYFPREKTWEALPPLPETLSGAGLVGCAAVNDGAGGMLIFGGVNAEIFREALENPPPDYLRRAPAWYRFNADVLRLSFGADGKAKWEKLGNVPATARAGASAAVVGARRGPAGTELDVVFVCGELKPGFRSPECVRIRIRTK